MVVPSNGSSGESIQAYSGATESLLALNGLDLGPEDPIWGFDNELFADRAGIVVPHVVEILPDTDKVVSPEEYELLRRIRASRAADSLPTPHTTGKIYDTPLTWADTSVDEELATSEAAQKASELELFKATGQDLLETNQEGHFKLIKLLGGAARIARQAKNSITSRVSTTFAARNESSHPINQHNTALLAVAALGMGVLGYVVSPETHTVTDKTVQVDKANTDQEMALLRSHMPKIETAPSGAWVPPSIKVWEQPVKKVLHAPELEPYDLLVDEQLILALMTPSSLGDPNAKGHNGRAGLMQIPKEVGEQYKTGYDPLNPADSILVGILDSDRRMKTALSQKDYSSDRAGLIRAIIEGPEPGLGYESVPQFATTLADRVIRLDARWREATNDDYDRWIADPSVTTLLNQATSNLLEQGLLVRKK